MAVEACTSELGPVDVLVNNAGIVNNIARIEDMTPEAWSHEVQVNLNGAFHCVRAAVPAMAERGWGRVVNIASVAALQPGLGQPAYSASKAGLVAFTRSVAQEFGAAWSHRKRSSPGPDRHAPGALHARAHARRGPSTQSCRTTRRARRHRQPRRLPRLPPVKLHHRRSHPLRTAGLLNAPAGGLDNQ